MAEVLTPFKNDVQKFLEELSNDYTVEVIAGVIKTKEGWQLCAGWSQLDSLAELRGHLFSLMVQLQEDDE
jgi:hypothetical protein